MKRILAIDDSTTNNILLEAVLKTRGYEIFIAFNIIEAYRILDEHPIDLILLDLLMPDISGFDFLEELQNNEKIKNIPVIVVSAASEPANRSRALKLGAKSFISKPIDINNFLDKVDNLITN